MNHLFLYLTTQDTHHIYFLLFFILTACGLGLPLPEDIPLIAAGYLIWQQDIKTFPTFLIAIIAILIGDSLLFFIGRKLGSSINETKKPIFRFMRPQKIAKAEALFEKYGDWVVFLGRFVAGIRAMIFCCAGILKMPYLRFIFFDGLAAFLSVPLWIMGGFYLGVYFGDEIDKILLSIKVYKNYFLLTIIIILLLAFLHFITKLVRVAKE
jgi:membrane protein DedA with SNARE-associated domain